MIDTNDLDTKIEELKTSKSEVSMAFSTTNDNVLALKIAIIALARSLEIMEKIVHDVPKKKEEKLQRFYYNKEDEIYRLLEYIKCSFCEKDIGIAIDDPEYFYCPYCGLKFEEDNK